MGDGSAKGKVDSKGARKKIPVAFLLLYCVNCGPSVHILVRILSVLVCWGVVFFFFFSGKPGWWSRVTLEKQTE